jgi:hypothetical protein
VVLLVLLLLVPCVVLFFAVSPQSAAHLRLFELPVIFWAIWALISLWAALNASTWLRTLGEPVDPLGPHALWDPLLGALNIGPPAGVMSRSPR